MNIGLHSEAGSRLFIARGGGDVPRRSGPAERLEASPESELADSSERAAQKLAREALTTELLEAPDSGVQQTRDSSPPATTVASLDCLARST